MIKSVPGIIEGFNIYIMISALGVSANPCDVMIVVRVSPSFTTYWNISEAVAVAVMVGVRVMVAVSVGVKVFVGLGVMVGVGVLVGKSVKPPLLMVTINMMIPITTSRIAAPPRISGSGCLRRLR
jgi:hypothetical protein